MTRKMVDQLERLVTVLIAEQWRKGLQKNGTHYTSLVRVSLLEDLERELRARGWNMDAVFTSMHEHRKAEYHAYLAKRAEREATQ